jgi:hypothetical protein
MVIVPVLERVVPLVVIWVGTLLSPFLTRREVFFSVSVAPDFRDTVEAKAVLRAYWLQLSLLMGGLLGIAWFTGGLAGAPQSPPWVLLWVVGVYLPGMYLAFLWARRRTLPHASAPSMVREASLSVARGAAFESLGWELPPFLVPVITGAYLASHRPEMPFMPLLLTRFLVLALLLFGRFMALKARRARVTGTSSEEDLRLRRGVSRVFLALEYVSSLAVLGPALIPVWPAAGTVLGITLAAGSLGLVVILLVLVLRSRRAGASSGGDGTDESHWKAGLFYVNPDDPAIFVEKRFGFGWTLNFGRPVAWALLLLLLLVPVAVLVSVVARH